MAILKIKRPPVESASPLANTVQQKFMTTRAELGKSLIERDDEIDLVLTALIAQEHPLLVGPPGTGKSFLLDSIMEWMGPTCNKFSVLLSKFTMPDEIFGPLDVPALTQSIFRRVTTGKLPEAHLAFMDETFKGSTAILNTALKIMNERTYENGDGTFRKCPLIMLMGGSNEWPNDQDGGKELGALFDRFLFRKWVKTISNRDNQRRLWWTRNHKPVLSTTITPAEIQQANAEASAILWTPQAMDAFERIVVELAKEGIRPGDRRQFKAVKACQAFAYLSGASSVETQHLAILEHILWDDPAEQPAKVAKVVARIANPIAVQVSEILAQVDEIMTACNPSDLTQNIGATTKLQERERKLAAIQSADRTRIMKAQNYIRSLLRELAGSTAANLNPLDLEEVR
jgi:MoxR-like ATPase